MNDRAALAADRRPIVFEHRLEDLQARGDGEVHQLGAGIDEDIDEWQMALGEGIDLYDRRWTPSPLMAFSTSPLCWLSVAAEVSHAVSGLCVGSVRPHVQELLVHE